MRCVIILLGAVTLSACTHVSTYRSQDLAALDDDQARAGVSYATPAIQYDIAVSRTLEKCKDDGTPVFAVKADAKSKTMPGERFEMDPSDLSSMFKTSLVGLEYYDDLGTLKSINAAADDRTGDILQDVVRVGIGIASATAGNPAGAITAAANAQSAGAPQTGVFSNSILKGVLSQYRSTQTQTPPVIPGRIRCTSLALERLANLKRETKRLKDTTASLEALTARIDQLKTLAALEGFDANSMQKLIALVDTQQKAEEAVGASKEEVKQALSKLQMSTSYVWPTVTSARPPASFPNGPAPFEPSATERKVICENLTSGDPDPAKSCEFAILAFGALTETRARLEHEATPVHATRGISTLTRRVNTQGANRGVMLREPVRGRLVVERLATDDSGLMSLLDPQKKWTSILRGDPQWIPQLGPLRFMPFVSGPFENEALSIALRRDGRIETIKYETKEAALARLTATGAKVSKEYADSVEARESERRDDIKYAREQRANQRADEIAKLDHDIAVLQKSETLIKQRAGPSEQEEAAAAELAQIRSEIATLTAIRDRLKLQQEVETLRTSATAP